MITTRPDTHLFPLTIHVEVPANTPAGAELFVAGDFNAWQPSNPLYKLHRNGNNVYRIDLQIDARDTQFKITRGTWDSAECLADGSHAANHQWEFDEPSEPVQISVNAWLDLNPAAISQRPVHTLSGDIRTIKDVYSAQLDNYRDLLVYLPPSYAHDPLRRYPVIYMQDGQNLFDKATAYAEEWQVDETCERLARDASTELIVVAIPNYGKQRLYEYGPWRDSASDHGGGGSRYVAFVADTIKPLVDKSFRTMPEPRSTGIFGSSMGALIALYAGLAKPDCFGLIGAMSPSLMFAHGAVLEFAKERSIPNSRVYIDCGGDEYPGLRARSRRLVESAQHLTNRLLNNGTQVQLVVDPRGQHNETAWSRRLPAALKFLLRPDSN